MIDPKPFAHLLEEPWRDIDPSLKIGADSEPRVGWRYGVTPPFPSSWPLTPQTRLHYYVFGRGLDLAGGLMDGEYVSGPWARIVSAADDPGQARLEMLAAELIEIGIQGVRPLEQWEIDILNQSSLLAAAITGLGKKKMPSRAPLKDTTKFYLLWTGIQGVIAKAIRPWHEDFFAWLK